MAGAPILTRRLAASSNSAIQKADLSVGLWQVVMRMGAKSVTVGVINRVRTAPLAAGRIKPNIGDVQC